MEGDGCESLTLSSCFVCYICGDFFKRPRVLPCGHTFCSECLAKLRDGIVSDSRSNPDHASVTDSAHKNPTTLSPEAVVVNNGTPTAVCKNSNGATTTSNVVSKDGASESKPSSSCVDDVDSILLLHRSPVSSNAHCAVGMKMSSSATYTCLGDKDRTIQTKSVSRKVSPGYKRIVTKSIERIPSMVTNSPQKSKQCSQCGSVVATSSQRNSSTSPIKRSTSLTSTRDPSPACSNDLPRWDSSSISPNRRSASRLQPPACSFEHKHGREMEPFVCPVPQCSYSMRVMNLARWSPRNKALANALAVWQRQRTSKQDCASQTDISNNKSMLVAIPRNLVLDSSSASSLMPLSRRRRHSSMVDIAVSVDGPLHHPAYLPRGHHTWKTYAALVGMNILQQILNL